MNEGVYPMTKEGKAIERVIRWTPVYGKVKPHLIELEKRVIAAETVARGRR